MQINWDDRRSGSQASNCWASADGAGLPTYEPKPFDGKWYSRAFSGPGLRHEIGASIGLGHIAWAHGPLPCGAFPDLKIFRLRVKQCLDPGGKVIADSGYQDERCQPPTGMSSTTEKLHSTVRAGQETVNKRLKQFFILSHRFRHNIALHSSCFHAVCNLTQLMIKRNEPLFDL